MESALEALVGPKAKGLSASTVSPPRCWMHKTGNVLNALPKTVQSRAKRALHGLW